MKTYRVTDYGVKIDTPQLQTEAFQAILDLCKETGGTVVIPKGQFYISSLRLWSNTTLYLESGAELYGSDNCDDYTVFPIPAHVNMRSDMELITQYYGNSPWETYRRAMITAYGEENIAIIGERDAVIDGVHCYDPNGEEHYRGPHIIFLSCCKNVRLEGYTARNAGNFLHEANNCDNVTMRRVTCLAGSDGIHLHCTRNMLIEECVFKTGDDCIAGINIEQLTVRKCILNTSCNLFRIGGVGILIEDCYAYGPGYYPHRMTIVKGKNNELPRESGRHNTLSVVDYFASSNYPFRASDIHFRNCLIENVDQLMRYYADQSNLQSGTHWDKLILENVCFTGLLNAATPEASAEEPLTVILKNVSVSFREESTSSTLLDLSDRAHTTLINETP